MIAIRHRLGPLDVFVLALWCGLAGGLLEVGTIAFCKALPGHRMYGMSRHFVWMAPLSNLLLFAGIGLVLALATKFWPRRAGWLSARLIGFLAVLPVLILMSSQIYPWAWAILALGISSRVVPVIERGRPRRGAGRCGVSRFSWGSYWSWQRACADEAGSRSGVRRAVFCRRAIPRTCS